MKDRGPVPPPSVASRGQMRRRMKHGPADGVRLATVSPIRIVPHPQPTHMHNAPRFPGRTRLVPPPPSLP